MSEVDALTLAWAVLLCLAGCGALPLGAGLLLFPALYLGLRAFVACATGLLRGLFLRCGGRL